MNLTLDKLLSQPCKPIDSSQSPLNLSEVENIRKLTPHWQYCATENVLMQTFHFRSYEKTIELANLVADVAKEQDHHPEMVIGYNRCKVSFHTHTIHGVSINDFICAAHIDRKMS